MKKKHEIRLWAVLFWLIVWQLVSMRLDSEILLVSPFRVLCRLGQLMLTAAFWKAVLFTLSRIAAGFFLAVLAGVALAASASRSGRIRELLAPVMLAVKSVPVASFIILALIWFSSKNLSVLISFLIVLPMIYTNVQSGIRAVDRQLLEMARVFRVPKYRVVLGMSWKAGVAAEVIGIPRGSVGERLQQAKVYMDTPDLFAWTLVIVAASLFFEKIVLFLMRRIAEKCSAL